MLKTQTGIPIDSYGFSRSIDSSEIFDRTTALMDTYLARWYNNDAESIVEDMRADLTTVLERYQFYHEFVSITKNFNFDPPIDTVSCIIRITDAEGDCYTRYRAIFDAQLNVIDDTLKA